MPLTQEQENQIFHDFLTIMKERYGDQWKHSLTKQLRPNPAVQIAELRGVSVADVRKVRSKLIVMGDFLRLVDLISEPPETYWTQ